MEENNEIQQESVSDKITFNLENFSGPLDLLIALIKKNKMEIIDKK